MSIHASIQNIYNSVSFCKRSWHHFFLGTLLLFGSAPAWAGEITSLRWDSTQADTMQVYINGAADYKLSTLEGGKRLRVTFPGSTLAQGASELQARGGVKGVYPYLADGGASVNVDILTNEPGKLKVSKTGFGYSLSVGKGQAAGSAITEAPVNGVVSSAIGGLRIEDLTYTTLPGSRVQLRMKMSGKPILPKAFKITNPARLAFDFPGTRLAPGKHTLKVGVGSLVSVKAIEARDRTRVVLNLVRPVGYQQDVIDNTLVVTLDGPTTRIDNTTDTISRSFSSAKPGRFLIQNIDFTRGSLGDAKLIVTLSDPAAGVDIKEQSGDIVLDFLNTSLPPNLERRLDVVDFATPVQTVDVFGRGKNTRMVVTPTGKFEHLAYQTGNIFTLNVKPVIEKKEKKKDEFGYSGEKLSLNFQNIEARAALQVLADFTGLNFVVSDSVSGELTLRLRDVPWDQALDLILDAKGLGMRKKGNVITIAPAEEIAAKEKAAFEAAKVQVEMEPLISELIQINYAKAEDIAKLLKSIKAISTGGVGGHPALGGGSVTITKESTDSNSLLSPRGQVTVDKRTNSVLVQDIPGKIREIRKLIAKLDQPVQQVLIESRLVEATDNFSKTLGAKFGMSSTQIGSSATVDQAALLNLDGATLNNVNGLNVNLPSGGIGTAPAGSLALTLAKLGTGGLLSLELSALEQEGQGKIVSSPRIVTANGQKAKIEQGQERVFTTSVLGVGTVVTKKAVLSLEVTPRITPDDRIIMDVIVSKDNFADAREGILNIKDIETQVLLNNGETVVIGGIYELDKNNTDTKVPFFGELPLLGWLFKNKEVLDTKTELLIFLTPKILTDLASAQ